MKTKKNQEITEIQLKVLSLFTKGFNRSYYIREVQKILKISSRTALLALNELERKEVLESQTRGKIILFSLRKSQIVKDYLLMAETYKKLDFLTRNKFINEIVNKITPNIEGIGIIFGSYVKGLENKDSDLDIFVIGSYKQKEIDKFSKLYNLEISVKCYPLNVFTKHINDDVLIKELLDNHITFKNTEHLIELAMEKYGKT